MKFGLAFAGLTVAASFIGAAHAEPAAQSRSAQPPWYDRFTYSSGLTTPQAGWSESEVNAALSWKPSTKWGVTLRVQEGRTSDHAAVSNKDEAAVEAFYQFTPRLRVGGEVSVAQDAAQDPLGLNSVGVMNEPAAGIRLESAFRF